MSIKYRTPKDSKFPARVHFNWGYHDGSHAVRQGWDRPSQYWGFAKELGEKLCGPESIVKHHFDKIYAEGWLMGLQDMRNGIYLETSEPAWIKFNQLSAPPVPQSFQASAN